MTIIGAVDFTDAAAVIARLGARLARRLHDDLLLVHAVEPSATFSGGLLPTAVDVAPAFDAATESLRRLREGVTALAGKVETRVVIGTPGHAVAEVAKETGARLILAGTHGRGAVGRLLVGSVTQKLLMCAPCPVLVVRSEVGAVEHWLAGERRLRVVVGVDRKGRATDAALDWARQLGELGPCDLTLVHEYWPPFEYLRLGVRGPRDLFETDPEVAPILERELEAKLGVLAWAPNARLRVRAAWGPVGDALAREAEVAAADLVIVGTEQPHGWRRAKRGSAAISTLHAVPMPLLCVPEQSQPRTANHGPALAPPLRSILVTTDFSEAGDAAVGHAFSLLRAEGGVVHLCHVHERPLATPAYAFDLEVGKLTPEHKSELEARLRALVPVEAVELGIEARLSVVDGGEPGEQIAAAALRVGADAIVLASHGRSGLKRAVLGSVAEAVLRKAEVPVYVVRRSDGAAR